ncbi:MAG: hypothetical protein NTY53_00970, partial [Kiritimatiellaeota bacterium]|nr:hypothetical protein [Kiritimatiellota bacterium]
SGPHRTEPIIESIAPVGPLSVTIQLGKQPTKVTLEPAGQPLTGDYRDGKLQLTIPQVAIHDIIAIEP